MMTQLCRPTQPAVMCDMCSNSCCIPSLTHASVCPLLQLLVSYLGSSFSGWMRGNSHSKPAVQDSLAAAIVATGVCDKPDSIAPMSKRAAARAARRAEARQQLAAAAAAAAGGGDVGVQQAQEDEGAAAPEADSQPVGRVCSPGSDQAAVQPQPQPPQLPFLLCGGRTDVGVSAVGQVG